MSRFCRLLVSVSWALGVLSLVVGVIFRLVPTLSVKTTFTSRGGITLAATLFLCALASGEMQRASSSGS